MSLNATCGTAKTAVCGENRHDDCQRFPSTGLLGRHANFTLQTLQSAIPGELQSRAVYSYVIKTVNNVAGRFVQTGSAPNFQGGVITLCTCRHKDRAYAPKRGCRGSDNGEPWKGIWVAGICGPEAFRPRGLFYLMLVEKVFDSHADAWTELSRPTAKSTHRNPFGDVYEPLPHLTNNWDAKHYRPTLTGHVHDDAGNRHKDIERVYCPGRHPKLLAGDVRHSYLWSAPLIRLNRQADTGWRTAHHRFYPRLTDFLALFT